MLDTCNVCYDRRGNKCVVCSFNMCTKCVKVWENNECPQCKKEYTFIHELDDTILRFFEAPHVLKARRSSINEDYIISLEKEWCWDKGEDIEKERYYYSPFVRNCTGKIIGSPSDNLKKVTNIPQRKRCFF